MIEFALVIPVFLLILVGVIEFGSAYSKVISLRQGIREGGRQASVANFGTSTGCIDPANFTGPLPSANIQKLICMTKDQSGVPDNVRVFVRFKTNDPSDPAPGPYSVGNSVVVCAIEPMGSLTVLMNRFLENHYARTKAAFRIEQVTDPLTSEVDSGEDDPSGNNWLNFCP